MQVRETIIIIDTPAHQLLILISSLPRTRSASQDGGEKIEEYANSTRPTLP